MKNNFLSLVTKMPQHTGGGNSQTKCATLALPLRYLCAMLLALVLSIGNVWADATYKLFCGATADVDGTNLNTTDFWTSATPTNGTNSDTYTKYVTFGGNVTGTTSLATPANYIAYSVKTTSTEIKVIVYNKNNSTQKLYFHDVKEKITSGKATASLTNKDIASKTKDKEITYTSTNDGKATIYISAGKATDTQIYQIIVTEKGTALTDLYAGYAGYSINLNKGRVAAKAGEVTVIDKLSICPSGDHKPTNNSEIKLVTLGTHYVSFTAQEDCALKLTVNSNVKYTLGSAKNVAGTTEYGGASGTYTTVLEEGETYFINPVSGNTSDFKITKIEFVPVYPVTYAAGEGSGTMDAKNYLEDDEVTLPACTFTAPTSSEFNGWVVTKTASGDAVTVTKDGDDYKFTMPAEAVTATAQWAAATTKYDVTAATGLTGGSVAASVAKEAEGETVTITVTPDFRYIFDAWDVYKTDDPTTKVSVTETAGVYTFEMPAYPVTVSATFTADSRKQILYLTSVSEADTKANDKLYAALNADVNYNVIIAAPEAQTLTNYDLVVLHESINGKTAASSDNSNKKQVILDIPTTTIPVLNTKSYFYNNANTDNQRWNWGTPNNGDAAQKVATLNTSYSNIADHPIFDGVTITANTVKVLTDAVTSGNTMQPIGTFTTGKEGYTLATTPNKDDDPTPDGCAIHELTPTQRGVASGKYLMISVSNAGLNNLTADGQKLFKNAAAYLMSATAWAPAAAADDDATLKALSVSGLTLAPTFDAATVDYTVTKAYGADDPVVGDVTATPTADGASAEVEWDGANKKFTITVTALDATTKKTYTITVNEAAAPKSLSRVLFSNGFDAFIDNTNHTVKAYYLAGQAAPTATTITAGAGTAGELSEGKIRVTGADDSYVDYIVTLEAVIPNTTTVAEEAAAGEFAGDEAWVKNGLLVYGNAAGYSAGDKWYVIRRLLKSGDAADDQRVIAGWVRSYFFVGNAYKFIMTASNNTAIKYSIDGGEQVASNAATVEITLPAGNHMIEIVSNQSSGDCRLSAPKLVERPATYSVTYTAGEGTGDDVVDAFEYAAGDEVTVQANAFTAPANKKFNGWASAPAVTISEGKFEMPASNVVLTAQWKEYFTITYKDGETILGTEDVFTDATPAGIADPSKAGYDFAGWVDGEDNPVTIASLSATTTVYAKWTADPCPDSEKKSIVKAVMTSTSTATVTGYNDNEYAGGYIINNLADGDNAFAYDFGEGSVTGYKLKGSGSAIFATLAKGGFEAGDKVVFAVTKKAGDNKLAVYAAKDKNNVLKLAEIDVADAGIYEYKLKAADIAAIEAAGADYKSIGSYRGDYNPFIYSVELKGCRSWAVMHTLTFKNIDGTATIAAEPLEEGAYASTVAPTAPKIAMKRFKGWSESKGGSTVDLTSYTITEDKILYAVYEDIVCPTTGTVYKFQLKTDLTDGKIFTSAPGELTLNTTDHLSSMVNGEVTVNLASDKNTNRVQFYDGKAIGFANGDGASITLTLDCALATGDEIRFINYAGSGNKMNLSDGAHSLELNGNNAETVQKITVNSDWNGADELTLTRGGNTPKLTYFEIYRPAKYDVSFNMMGHGSAIADLEDVVEGSKIVAPSPAPTDVDYSFAGWYKENTLENEWKFDVDVVETNTTLYAKWLDKSDATLKSLKYGETDIVLVVDQDTYDITLPSLTSSVPALTAETNNPNATKLIANGTFDGAGNATSTVTVTPEVGADKVYTVNFARGIALEQVTVTTSMEWDWSAAGVSAEIKESNTPGLSGNDVVIANVPGVKNDADFNSQALKASGTNAIRTEYFQGKQLNIKTDKEGLLIVDFGGTNGNARVLKVYDNADNEIAAWNYNSEARQVQQVVVPAGGVTLKAFEGASGNNARIYNLKFYALAYTRDDDWMAPGELGTVCYPEGLVAVGAEMYKMAGVDDNNKFVFDEVSVLDPGKPYLFVAQSNVLKFYATTATAAGAAGTNNGMVGTFASIDLSHTDARAAKWYYFSGKKFYSVSKRTSDLNVPANRAYVDMNTPVLAGAPKHGVRRITFDVQGTNIATGVENAAATDKPAKMLINGQLFILRGEKMYDAKGQLVK